MRLKRVNDMGDTVRRIQGEKVVHEDMEKETKEVSGLVSKAFSETDAKMVKIASVHTEDLLDQLSKRFKVTLSLEMLRNEIREANPAPSRKTIASEEEKPQRRSYLDDLDSEEDEDNEDVSSKGIVADREKIAKTIAYPAIVNNYDPDYSCTVKMHRPQDDLCAVTVYLLETSIGQYAYKNNFFFKAGNEKRAARCFKRILSMAEDIREQVVAGDIIQQEIPLVFQRKLQGEETEYQQDSKWNVAVYLDPKNVAKFRGGKENFPNMRDQKTHFNT